MLEKEVIFKEDLELIFGKRPFDKDVLPLINPVEPESKANAENNQKTIEGKKEEDVLKETKGEVVLKDIESEKPLNTLF